MSHHDLLTTDRLHLLLATGSAVTGTTWGATMAVLVVLVVLARAGVRRRLGASAAVRRGVLAATQQRSVLLDPPGEGSQAVAGP